MKRTGKLLLFLAVLVLALGLTAAALAEHTHGGRTFTEWTAADSLPASAGDYYLTENVTLSDTWTVPDGTVNLCLNGYGIIQTGEGSVLLIDGGDLILWDEDGGAAHYILLDENGRGTEVVDSQPDSGSYAEVSGGFVTGGSATNGGGVYVNSGTFTVNGGMIAGNTASEAGGGLYVAGGQVTLNQNGKLDHNTAKNGGGAYAAGGSLDMAGGYVRNNTASASGGGLYIDGGEVTMYGENEGSVASIKNNTANDGGGVYVKSGTLSISDNSMLSSNNATTGSGGGLYLYDGTVTMIGGAIGGSEDDANTASNGGGVYVAGGAFALSGGSIANNSAANNEGTSRGGGVYVADGTFALSGSPVISGNTAGEADSGVYLSEDKVISIADTLGSTASVGVTMEVPSVFTSGLDGNGTLDNFTSEDTNLGLRLTSEGEAELFQQFTASFIADPSGETPYAVQNVALGEKLSAPEAPTYAAYAFFGWYAVDQSNEAWQTDGNNVLYVTINGIDYTVTEMVSDWEGKNADTYMRAWDFANDTVTEAVTLYAKRLPAVTTEQGLTSALSSYSGSLIRLGADITLTAPPEYAAEGLSLNLEKEKTIDLNGHTLELNGKMLQIIANTTVQDNSTGGGGKITGHGTTKYVEGGTNEVNTYAVTVYAEKTLIVESGAIEGLNDGVSVSGTLYVKGTGKVYAKGAGNNTGIAILNKGSVYIQGGTVQTDTSVAIHNNAGTVTVSGGDVLAPECAVRATGGTVKVSGGAITAQGEYGIDMEGGTLEVTGGSVSANKNTVYVKKGAQAAVQGGSVSATAFNALFVRGTATVSGEALITAADYPTVNVNSTEAESRASVTVTAGTIKQTGNGEAIRIGDNGSVTMAGGTVEALYYDEDPDNGGVGIDLKSSTGELTLSGGTLSAYGCGVMTYVDSGSGSAAFKLSGSPVFTGLGAANSAVEIFDQSRIAITGALSLSAPISVRVGGESNYARPFTSGYGAQGYTNDDVSSHFVNKGGMELRCENGEVMGEMRTPALEDFSVVCPENLVFDETPKAVTVEPAEGVEGMGTIKVSYLLRGENQTATEEPPTEPGVYDVLIETEEGDNYFATSTPLQWPQSLTIIQSHMIIVSEAVQGLEDAVTVWVDNENTHYAAENVEVALYTGGYTAADLTVTYETDGNPVEAEVFQDEDDPNWYYFTMPAANVTVSASAVENDWDTLYAALAAGGDVVLTKNVIAVANDCSGPLEIPADKNVTLDLNGYMIDGCAYGDVVLNVHGELTISDQYGGGAILANADTAVQVEGVLCLADGQIINDGDVVAAVSDSSEFYMEGGLIGSGSECGVSVEGGGFFLSGGEITSDTWNYSVYVSSGSFNVSGDPCIAWDVFLEENMVITLDGELTNTEPIYVEMEVPGVFTSGLSTYGAAANFASADTDYAAGVNSDGEAFLGTPCGVTVADGVTGGDVIPSVDAAPAGALITLVIVPDEHYELASLTVNDTDVTESVSDGAYSFYMPENGAAVEAAFSLIQYTVSFAAGYDNPPLAMEAVTVDAGGDYELPACGFAPPAGLEFAGWLVDDETTPTAVGTVITMIDNNVALTAAWQALSAPRFAGYRLRLTGVLGLRFFMEIPEAITEGTMTFTIENKSESFAFSASETEKASANGTDYYVFTCSVYAYQMAEMITAEFTYGDNQSVSREYSVEQYLGSVRDGDYSQNAKKLVDATRAYGRYIQPYLDAANGTTHAQMEYEGGVDVNGAKEGAEDYALQKRTLDSDYLEKAEYHLTLGASSALNVEITMDKAYADVAVLLDDHPYTPTVSGNVYKVNVRGIAANELGTAHRVEMKVGGVTVFDVTLSSISYVNTVLTKAAPSTAEENAMAALYHYYDKAKTYAEHPYE